MTKIQPKPLLKRYAWFAMFTFWKYFITIHNMSQLAWKAKEELREFVTRNKISEEWARISLLSLHQVMWASSGTPYLGWHKYGKNIFGIDLANRITWSPVTPKKQLIAVIYTLSGEKNTLNVHNKIRWTDNVRLTTTKLQWKLKQINKLVIYDTGTACSSS